MGWVDFTSDKICYQSLLMSLKAVFPRCCAKRAGGGFATAVTPGTTGDTLTLRRAARAGLVPIGP